MNHESGSDVADYLELLRASGRADSTLMLRRSQLGRLSEGFPKRSIRTLSEADLVRFFAEHSRWGSSTAYSYRATLKDFYGMLLKRGAIESNPVNGVPRIRVRNRTMIAAPESAVVERDDLDDRTRLMLDLGARQGLRRAEIAQIQRRDLVREDGGWSLIVHGKGSKDRVVPLHHDIAERILASPYGWLFPSPNGGHLSASYVGEVLGNVLPEGWSSHSLRRRFATKIYSETKDLRAVQQLLGHTSLDVTQRYIGTRGDALRDALGHA